MAQTYLLIHPERFPSNDALSISADNTFLEAISLRTFEDQYGAAISQAAATCHRRIALIDELDWEDLESGDDDCLTVGLPAEGWQLIAAGALEVVQKARRALGATKDTILLGGYARHDCVARVHTALTRAGLKVELHQEGVLPLNQVTAQHYFESQAPKPKEL